MYTNDTSGVRSISQSASQSIQIYLSKKEQKDYIIVSDF